MVARPWRSSRLPCGEGLLLRCDGNAGNSFPTTQGKDPSSRAMRQKRGSSGCGRDSCYSSQVETGMSRNFLSYSKGVKDPLEVPDIRCDFPRFASAEMGLISPLRMPRSMSALERNPQVPAPNPHKVLGPGIDGRGTPRGPRATGMGTGLSSIRAGP